ncbi:hypotheticla protein [Erwinia phage vB_EamP-S2]|uniref:Hypotheticla protein n=1 Tax=Erwinia phage vB_EamP-S2 TaxID=2070198 RepID=A0A2K9V4Z3_9CAUD|nr:hypotheticla protein [Erwinia phage vB_EamP-S2]AUV57227.1 hypotheticla protein [Erwinia phage vB_EamP-S2]
MTWLKTRPILKLIGVTHSMTQTTVRKLPVHHEAYDAILEMMHLIPEGPESSPEVLKWNSAIRDLRGKFQYKFVRD